MNEQSTEQMIQDKGLTAPRLSPAHIDAQIVGEFFFTAAQAIAGAVPPGANGDFFEPLRTLTFCVLVLRNGHMVTGETAPVSAANFDAEVGRKVARERAREKIWALEGYLLREQIYQRDVAAAQNSARTPEISMIPGAGPGITLGIWGARCLVYCSVDDGQTYAQVGALSPERGDPLRLNIDGGYAGKTLHFKFCNYDSQGQTTQNLADVQVYSYTVPSRVGGYSGPSDHSKSPYAEP